MHMQLRRWLAMFTLLSCGPVAALQAQDKSNWLDDQTVIVARMSVAQPEQSTAILDLLADTAKPVANELSIWKGQLTSISEAVKAAGGSELVVVYSLSDAFTDQPFLVFPGARTINLDLMRSTLAANGVLNPFRGAPAYRSATMDGAAIVGTSATLTRMLNHTKTPTKRTDERLNRAAGDNILSLTAALNSDQRRAFSEMAATLPTYLGGGKVSELLTEVETLQVDVTKSQQLILTLTGNTAAIETRLKNIQTAFAADPAVAASAYQAFGKFVVDQLVSQAPQRKANSLTWTAQLSDVIKSELGVALGKAMLESDEMTAAQRLKILGLAMHNHHSAYKKFPSVLSAGGKPRKLSWRVDLLPFMGYDDLWKEFHLDEPFDSQHNKKLIPRMPEVFRCPQSKHAPTTGLSTFVLPVHEKGMWSKTWQTEFPGIEDGTSNTIMTVEVRDELAQIWTKPEPFEVDLTAPEKQFGGHFEGKILFGAGDGSASMLEQEQFKILPALITRAGGEVVQY